ncbi:hypothetical protein CI102_6158 [Trichoderma harzianum]|nr:hypothetical protein CI102_6158 [Trichoderma harzianum]
MLRSRQKMPKKKGFKKTFNCDFSHDIVPSPRAIRPKHPSIHDSMQHKPHQRSILTAPPEMAPQAPVQLTAHSSKAPIAPPEPTKNPAQVSGPNCHLDADRRDPKGLVLIHGSFGVLVPLFAAWPCLVKVLDGACRASIFLAVLMPNQGQLKWELIRAGAISFDAWSDYGLHCQRIRHAALMSPVTCTR